MRMYVCMYAGMHVCMYLRMWARDAAATMAECEVHNRDILTGTVTILRTKQQGFNSRRGEPERGSETEAVTVRGRRKQSSAYLVHHLFTAVSNK